MLQKQPRRREREEKKKGDLPNSSVLFCVCPAELLSSVSSKRMDSGCKEAFSLSSSPPPLPAPPSPSFSFSSSSSHHPWSPPTQVSELSPTRTCANFATVSSSSPGLPCSSSELSQGSEERKSNGAEQASDNNTHAPSMQTGFLARPSSLLQPQQVSSSLQRIRAEASLRREAKRKNREQVLSLVYRTREHSSKSRKGSRGSPSKLHQHYGGRRKEEERQGGPFLHEVRRGATHLPPFSSSSGFSSSRSTSSEHLVKNDRGNAIFRSFTSSSSHTIATSSSSEGSDVGRRTDSETRQKRGEGFSSEEEDEEKAKRKKEEIVSSERRFVFLSPSRYNNLNGDTSLTSSASLSSMSSGTEEENELVGVEKQRFAKKRILDRKQGGGTSSRRPFGQYSLRNSRSKDVKVGRDVAPVGFKQRAGELGGGRMGYSRRGEIASSLLLRSHHSDRNRGTSTSQSEGFSLSSPSGFSTSSSSSSSSPSEPAARARVRRRGRERAGGGYQLRVLQKGQSPGVCSPRGHLHAEEEKDEENLRGPADSGESDLGRSAAGSRGSQQTSANKEEAMDNNGREKEEKAQTRPSPMTHVERHPLPSSSHHRDTFHQRSRFFSSSSLSSASSSSSTFSDDNFSSSFVTPSASHSCTPDSSSSSASSRSRERATARRVAISSRDGRDTQAKSFLSRIIKTFKEDAKERASSPVSPLPVESGHHHAGLSQQEERRLFPSSSSSSACFSASPHPLLHTAHSSSCPPQAEGPSRVGCREERRPDAGPGAGRAEIEEPPPVREVGNATAFSLLRRGGRSGRECARQTLSSTSLLLRSDVLTKPHQKRKKKITHQAPRADQVSHSMSKSVSSPSSSSLSASSSSSVSGRKHRDQTFSIMSLLDDFSSRRGPSSGWATSSGSSRGSSSSRSRRSSGHDQALEQASSPASSSASPPPPPLMSATPEDDEAHALRRKDSSGTRMKTSRRDRHPDKASVAVAGPRSSLFLLPEKGLPCSSRDDGPCNIPPPCNDSAGLAMAQNPCACFSSPLPSSALPSSSTDTDMRDKDERTRREKEVTGRGREGGEGGGGYQEDEKGEARLSDHRQQSVCLSRREEEEDVVASASREQMEKDRETFDHTTTITTRRESPAKEALQEGIEDLREGRRGALERRQREEDTEAPQELHENVPCKDFERKKEEDAFSSETSDAPVHSTRKAGYMQEENSGGGLMVIRRRAREENGEPESDKATHTAKEEEEEGKRMSPVFSSPSSSSLPSPSSEVSFSRQEGALSVCVSRRRFFIADGENSQRHDEEEEEKKGATPLLASVSSSSFFREVHGGGGGGEDEKESMVGGMCVDSEAPSPCAASFFSCPVAATAKFHQTFLSKSDGRGGRTSQRRLAGRSVGGGAG